MVWTEITRPKYCRDGLRYASDTTDEEWAMIAPYMPCKNRRGRPRVTAISPGNIMSQTLRLSAKRPL